VKEKVLDKAWAYMDEHGYCDPNDWPTVPIEEFYEEAGLKEFHVRKFREKYPVQILTVLGQINGHPFVLK
jgi:hypothetical protein